MAEHSEDCGNDRAIAQERTVATREPSQLRGLGPDGRVSTIAQAATPDLTAQQVLDKLAGEFGPGFSSGVHAILLHDALPEHFGKKDWAKWFFKPADAAFAWAHDAGLIVPWKLTSKWQFTPLGIEVAALASAQASS